MVQASSRFVSYKQRILETDPSALWALNDKVGTVAWDASRNWRNSIHSNVTLRQPGIGDGGESCLYVPANNSYTDIYSAAYNAAFNGQLGSFGFWIKARVSGVWTSGTEQRIAALVADGNNYIIIRSSGAGGLQFLYNANGTLEVLSWATASADWLFVVTTWSLTNDLCTLIVNGVQRASANTLGTYAGAQLNTQNCLGAGSTAGNLVWDGYIQMASLWNYALTENEVAALYPIQ